MSDEVSILSVLALMVMLIAVIASCVRNDVELNHQYRMELLKIKENK